MAIECRQQPRHQVGGQERPRGVVDQHTLGRQDLQRLEPPPDGLLPRRAAGDGVGEVCGKRPRCLFVAVPVGRMDDDLGAADLGVAGQHTKRVGQHRRTGKWEILLGNIARAAQALAPAARHNHRYCRCHCRFSRETRWLCLDGPCARSNVDAQLFALAK